MDYWINTYHPLAGTPAAPWAAFDPPLPQFADASCRREPDLEAARPAVTGLCRGHTRAVRMFHRHDIILYFTVKGRYCGLAPHRRLTAVLRVIAERPSHADAARWYDTNGFALPRNIMVAGNPPLPLEMTEGGYRENGQIVLPRDSADAARVLGQWDHLYQKRSDELGDVRVCFPLRVNISEGFLLSDHFTSQIFGHSGFPNTQFRPAKVLKRVVEAVLLGTGNDDLIEKLETE